MATQRYPRGNFRRFKRSATVSTSVASAYPYPHIPEAAQDRAADTLTGPFASEPFSVQRVVQSKSTQPRLWAQGADQPTRNKLF